MEYVKTRIIPQFDRLGYGNYTVLRKADRAKIGACGLYDRAGVEGIDLGFAFLPEYEGQGYGFEAASKIKEAAFEIFRLDHLGAITVPDNHASRKLLEKLGFEFHKMIRLPHDETELMLHKPGRLAAVLPRASPAR
jgi:RimJ/RimL family protein N-acetyltransferase